MLPLEILFSRIAVDLCSILKFNTATVYGCGRWPAKAAPRKEFVRHVFLSSAVVAHVSWQPIRCIHFHQDALE